MMHKSLTFFVNLKLLGTGMEETDADVLLVLMLILLKCSNTDTSY